MVPGSKTEGGGTGTTHLLSARVRKTIQSIKEIVGNHSDADIYVALKEANMDPNETTQKLLNQDPFHEVKRRRDRKKETQNVGNRGQPSADSRRPSENNSGQGMKFHTHSERNVRRTNYSRSTFPGISREFRVVRDNRVNHIYKEVTPLSQQHSTSVTEQLNVNISDKGSSTSTNHRPSGSRNSSQASNGPSDSHARYAPKTIDRKIVYEDKDKQGMISNAAGRVQPIKPNSVHQNSALVASTSSAVGVYSSSTDPVHVPSPDSRSPGVVGAIRREVGFVGVRRQSSDNKAKQSFAPSSPHVVGKDGTSADSFQSVGAVSKTEQFSQTNVTEPSLSGMPVSRPSLNNQHNNRPHQQLLGHQRVSQQNKEWKPKSSQKPNCNNSPGVIGTPKKAAAAASPPAENSGDIESNTVELQDKLSQVNIYENQNVIIAQHIRVPETDRCRLTFGTIGTELDSSRPQSKYHIIGASEKSNEELTASLTVPAPELSTDDVSGSKQVDLRDEHIRSLGSDSPVSSATSEQQLPDNKDSSNTKNLDNYANIGLVRDSSPSYAPSEQQQQDSHDMPGFAALISHPTNTPASTIAMVQQQQPPVPQMYPQVHVSHFANLMPYRQFLSPVYVPPMAMPGYSSNPPYPHPTNGSSYLLMPGGGSHLNANNLKYGVQQFKPVPAGSPTGFGNFANPTGYAMITPGVVGGATALEDSSRVKYKDNLYVPNPQAETSEIWLQNPRDHPGMQSTPYYNMPGQTPHAAYMPSHTGHASFNGATAQSSHMQFPGMYHTPPQPAAMASPHHLGPPAIGNNVGVGVAAAAPGAQVGAYQQPQLGHINWTTNF
ncbi:GBF-interacting protein 1 [Glycine soja]